MQSRLLSSVKCVSSVLLKKRNNYQQGSRYDVAVSFSSWMKTPSFDIVSLCPIYYIKEEEWEYEIFHRYSEYR